ncbi:MAG: hypothetical protein IKU04_05205, partial [Bacteroidales bacterium]|nr:hypothetical protein [Bacteroidales bacterium]
MENNSYLIIGIVFVAALIVVWALTHVIVTLRWKGRTLQALSEKKVEEALRKQQAESLQQQMASVRAEMTARTETILKEREEELSRKARETFEGISGGLSRDLSAMKDAFEAGKKAQAEDAATLRERFDAAVRELEAQS